MYWSLSAVFAASKGCLSAQETGDAMWRAVQLSSTPSASMDSPQACSRQSSGAMLAWIYAEPSFQTERNVQQLDTCWPRIAIAVDKFQLDLSEYFVSFLP